MKINISVPDDFSFEECLVLLGRNSDEILYEINAGKIDRLIKTTSGYLPVNIAFENRQLQINTHGANAEQSGIKPYIQSWFDTERNLSPFYQCLETHPKLAPLLQFKGLRIIGIPDLFEALCWTIIGQQINLAFAYKLKSRLTQAYGHSTDWNDKKLWHFPSPEDLLEIPDTFRATNQFSRSKVKYLMNTAEAFVDGSISLEKLQVLSSFSERQALLTQVKGIGEWSANYALMKTMHQPEAIPFGDTGLTQALYNLGIIKDRKDRPAIEEFFKTVKGWEAYTSFYLWRSLY